MKTTLTVALAAAAMMLGAGVASAHDKNAKGVHHHAHHAHHAAHHKHASKHAEKHAAKKAHKHAAKHGHKHIVSKKAVKKAG